MKNPSDEKLIYNLGLSVSEIDPTSQMDSLELLSLEEEDLCFYLQSIFQSNGNLFASFSGDYIISLEIKEQEKAKNIQKALQKLKIYSIIVKQERKNDACKILITQKTSLDNFKIKISSDFANGSEVIDHFIFKIDWED